MVIINNCTQFHLIITYIKVAIVNKLVADLTFKGGWMKHCDRKSEIWSAFLNASWTASKIKDEHCVVAIAIYSGHHMVIALDTFQ